MSKVTREGARLRLKSVFQYAIIGCFTIFVYDYFLTLNDEVRPERRTETYKLNFDYEDTIHLEKAVQPRSVNMSILLPRRAIDKLSLSDILLHRCELEISSALELET